MLPKLWGKDELPEVWQQQTLVDIFCLCIYSFSINNWPYFVLAREAGLLARLRHPNIVSLHKVVDTGTTVVLLLELISGGELFHWVPSGELEAAHVVCNIKLFIWKKYFRIQVISLILIYFFIGPSSLNGT